MAAPEAMTRRGFLHTSAVAAAAMSLAPAAQARNATDRIQIGLLGIGGRCRQLHKALVNVPNIRITAVCDIYDKNLDDGRKLADPAALATKRYQDVLDRKDIDAVLIATPDHWHVPMTVDACAAGKDVYVEKPLTHNLGEGQAVIEAQN